MIIHIYIYPYYISIVIICVIHIYGGVSVDKYIHIIPVLTENFKGIDAIVS